MVFPKFSNQPRVRVFPVLFLPRDVHLSQDEIKCAKTLIGRHLMIARKLYKQLLQTDTFELVDNKVRLFHSKSVNSHFTELVHEQKVKSSYYVLSELFIWQKTDRYCTNRVFLVIYVRPPGKPYDGGFNLLGGGRTINGAPNSGGGYVEMEYTALISDQPYPFQSTLVHELGHAFGLSHSDCLGYDMSSSESIMSYNLAHHSKGLQVSDQPGGFLAEEYYLLSLNKRAFPHFKFIPAIHNPENRDLSKIENCLLGPIGEAVGAFRQLPGIGYELYFNGRKVNGAGASLYSLKQAKANCNWNLSHQKNVKVECRYNGTPFTP